MLEGSIFIHVLTKIYDFFSKQFCSSRIIQMFLTENDSVISTKNSVFNKVAVATILGVSNLAKKIGLIKLLDGSVFKIPFLWCMLTITLAPILPTMIVLTMSLTAFVALLLQVICRKGKRLKYYAINKYIYLYALSYIYATITSVTLKGSLMGGLLSVFFMLFFTVMINSIKTKQQLKAVLFMLVSAGVFVSLYGFYQFMFPDQFSGVWHDKTMFEEIIFRVYSTLENPNVLGEYLLLIIPVAFACFLNHKNKLMKIFYLGATAAMFLCLILTYSRGCYLGILIAAGIFLVLLDRRFILLGLLGLLLLPMLMPEAIINRFLSIGNMADSSTSYRVYIWLGTVAMLKDYWLCGIGPGAAAFNIVYPAYAFNSISAPHSHNLYLQIICDAGIIGFILFAFIIYHFYKASFAGLLRERRTEHKIYIISGISAISGFLVQSFSDYTFYNYRVMLLFWVFLALGIIFSNMSRLKGVNSHERDKSPKHN